MFLRAVEPWDLMHVWEWLSSPDMVANSQSGVVKEFAWLVDQVSDARDDETGDQWLLIVDDRVGMVTAGFLAVIGGEVTLYVAPWARRQGHGTAALRALGNMEWPWPKLTARVRVENPASRRTFEQAGFQVVMDDGAILHLSREVQHG